MQDRINGNFSRTAVGSIAVADNPNPIVSGRGERAGGIGCGSSAGIAPGAVIRGALPLIGIGSVSAGHSVESHDGRRSIVVDRLGRWADAATCQGTVDGDGSYGTIHNDAIAVNIDDIVGGSGQGRRGISGRGSTADGGKAVVVGRA